MPPKKKQEEEAIPADAAVDIETEKESVLQAEYDQLMTDLNNLRKKVHVLKKENEDLQEEANLIRMQNQEYMSYNESKSQRRKNNIVTITDYTNAEIQKIEKQKEQMMKEFSEQKEALEAILREKEAKLASIQEHLDVLGVYREKQNHNEEQIRQLEKDVIKVRLDQSRELNKQKQAFLAERESLETESKKLIEDTATHATREAVTYLSHHTTAIGHENADLRKRLLHLINYTRQLQNQKHQLQEQHEHLQQEKKYADDLKKIRREKEQRLADKLGIELSEETQQELLRHIGIDLE